MKKVLITGRSGLLGKEILKGFLKKKNIVYFTSTLLKNSKKLISSLSNLEKKNCYPIIQKFENINDIKFFIKKYAEVCPLGRMLNYREIFEPVWFLSSEKSSSGATGHNLVIDGGRTIW